MNRVQALVEWSQLRASYIDVGVPFQQPLIADPELSLVFDPSPSRLGLRLCLPEDRAWSGLSRPMKNVLVRKVLLDGIAHVEILTASPELFRTIYALIGDVLSRVRDGQFDVLRALELSLGDFETLLCGVGGISREKAVGLFGELWVLRALVLAKIAALGSWVGCDMQLHDFRIGAVELEIKTTTGNARRHSIHGLNQLTASPGHSLHLISIRIGLAGAEPGESIKDLVEFLREALSPADMSRFDTMVASIGYSAMDEECLVRYRLTGIPMLVSVGEDFPEMSYAWLHQVMGGESASRVRNVDLYLDLEGLGKPFDVMSIRAGLK